MCCAGFGERRNIDPQPAAAVGKKLGVGVQLRGVELAVYRLQLLELGAAGGARVHVLVKLLFLVEHVEETSDLGVEPNSVLEVYNKSERLGDHERPAQRHHGVLVSAITGDGIGQLIALIRERQLARGEVMHLLIPHSESREIAALHELAEIHSQRDTEDGMHAVAWVPTDVTHRFEPFREGNHRA